MSVYKVRNSVPTAEEMGKLLGISPEQVSAVRSIMEAPQKPESSTRSRIYQRVVRRGQAKKASKKAR
jgi:hypothetical protein